MANREIREVGTFKASLSGTELVEIQEAAGGLGSSKRTTTAAIAALVSVPVSPVQSVQGRFGHVVLVKADIGLGSVDNTADIDKPISILQQAELDTKADIDGQIFTGAIEAPAITVAVFNVISTGDFSATLNSKIAVGAGMYKLFDGDTVSILGTGEPAVVMVNGQQGIVELTTDDISEGVDNLYFPEAPINGLPFVRKDGGWVEQEGSGSAVDIDYDNAYRDWETDRKSTRLNSSHSAKSRMPSSA